MSSVLQDWVTEMPLRHQAVLMAAVRGCDTVPKYPLDSPERHLVAWVRWCFLVPADEREVDTPGGFMLSYPPVLRPSSLGHHPQHWYSHVMHAIEVLAYYHPDGLVRAAALNIYAGMVDNMHLRPETRSDLYQRLTADRIAAGTVVQ